MFRRISRAGRVLPYRLSDRAIVRTVKLGAVACGLDQTKYSARSLRSGFLTSAAKHGANPFRMREVSRHASLETILRYVVAADPFEDRPGSDFL